MKLKVLDLFSGIGGFSLGLERAKHDGKIKGFETVAFCEIEEFPRKVLAKHWPQAPCYNDVRTLTAEQLVRDGIGQIDAITGGFPCQDISVAGKQAGIGEGTRSGLWSECLRLVSELRPKYAIFENVANLLFGPSGKRGGWFSRILSDLASIGYDVEWHSIPACFIGAWHKRARIWILAYPNKKRCKGKPPKPMEWQRQITRQSLRSFAGWPGRSNLPSSRFCRANDGIPSRVDRTSALGNAVIPQIPELIGNAILESINT